jgi:ABC-type sugar transport system permease subunit
MASETKVKKKKKKNLNNTGYLFVAPFVIVFLIFNVYPVLRTLYLSFTDYKGFGDAIFSGGANYSRVLHDKFFWRALGNTAKIWGVNIVLQLGLALLLTIVFSDIKYKIRGLGIFRALYYLPNLIAADFAGLEIRYNQSDADGYWNDEKSSRLAGLSGNGTLCDLRNQCLDVVRQFIHHAYGWCTGNLERLL